MENSKGNVMTVRGLIPASEMGKTLTHEHLRYTVQFWGPEGGRTPEEEAFFNEKVSIENLHRCRWNQLDNLDNCELYDSDVVVEELKYFTDAGGRTICDVSPEGLCKYDYARSLVDISKKTGVNIVGTVGYHIQSLHPERVKSMTADEIAEEFLDVIRNGYRDYREAKPGIIGEMGTSEVIKEEEIKALRGAARASVESGLALSIHTSLSERTGHQILDILEDEGIDFSQVILDHVDAAISQQDTTFDKGVDYIKSLADRGCYVEFTCTGNSFRFVNTGGFWWLPTDLDRARAIKELCERGHARRILISHDGGHKSFLKKWGGWGYAHVLSGFKDTLLRVGLDERIIDSFSVDNPRRVLTIRTH